MNHLRWPLLLPIAAMAIIVTVSNFAVQFPIKAFGLGDYLTWGAFTYPFSFFVNELTKRPGAARRRGGGIFLFSWGGWFFGPVSPPRGGGGRGGGLFFPPLRRVRVGLAWAPHRGWGGAPFCSAGGSAVDTAMFFSLAFVGTPVPWVSLAITDFFVKLGFAAALVGPFGYLRRMVPAYEEVESRA